MKNPNNKKKQDKPPKGDDVRAGAGAERYRAPLPQRSDGKVVGVDSHPDFVVAAVCQGREAFSARTVEVTGQMGIGEFVQWAAGRFRRDDLILVEASGNSFHLCAELQAAGLRCAVVESAALSRYADPWKDDDRRAAERIVTGYLTGLAPCVWTPDEKTRERRDLLHCYRRAEQEETAAGNEIKGFLNQHGIRAGKRSLKNSKTLEWVLAQRQWSPVQRRLIEERFAAHAAAARRRREFRSMICAQIAACPLMRRCMRLAGIGPINAFAALAVIGDCSRFACPKSLAAYLGLNPGAKTSGASKHAKVGVGKGRGRQDMRTLLIQAAQALLRSRRPDPLQKWGAALLFRKGHRNIAVAAVARKLAMRLWRVLSFEQPIEGIEHNDALLSKMRKLLTDMGRAARADLGLTGTLLSDAALLCLLNPLPAPPSP
ncbi:MAG: IS110 family transposase [Kiritimatiellaeota bacterium]|nr:IS110 family transposase [Kiritimatiellota bacterium]